MRSSLLMFSLLTAGFAQAADVYPAKAVRMLVPTLPGGGGDATARVIAPKLAELWGQPVFVDNRAGSGGTVGMGVAARLPADGYTLVMGASSYVVVAPAVYPKLAYDTVRDFSPVTQILYAPLLLVSHPSLPATDVRGLIALARAKPDAISYATPGNGSVAHLAMEMFKSLSGTRILHIPYRGAAQALTDVIAGEVSVFMSTIPAALPFQSTGRLKMIATTGLTRSRILPRVPTVSESGLKNYEVTTWYGILVPAGTPETIVNKLQADIARIIRQLDTKERIANEGGDVVASTPAQFGDFIAGELAKWAKVGKASGAKVD
ncbi:MAG: tripartite tricarboxylate transporter substrate binding protein [Burkholderiales bacterium]